MIEFALFAAFLSVAGSMFVIYRLGGFSEFTELCEHHEII